MSLVEQLRTDETLRQKEFPVTSASVFMAHAGVTILPRRVTSAMQQYLEQSCLRHQEYPEAWKAVLETRALAARLIGAKASEIALLGPTSLGLNLVALGLEWAPGDEVVCYLDDYPANVYPWMELQRKGVTVRFLKPNGLGGITPEIVAASLTARTKLVSIASCHYLTGNRIDLPTIGSLLKSRGILFCLDAIQTLGAFKTTVEHVDFLSADAHKWLLGPMSAGIVYVREELHERLRPALLGSWNVRSPQFIAQETIEFESGGRRFEPGAMNIAGILGMRAALELIGEAGVDAISARLLQLREMIHEALPTWEFLSVVDGCLPSGIITGRPLGATEDQMTQLFARLTASNIVASHRHDRSGKSYIRFSPHFYNHESEIERLASVINGS
ncbi:MAG: aminotransferase class V-fold PLP-dependent enzyme [Verrucomicrobiaceae bacterium]|nr:aminotransferase class V-fold PLP-dependent enzyme [Verrucomicrobiaceae bacterium]